MVRVVVWRGMAGGFAIVTACFVCAATKCSHLACLSGLLQGVRQRLRRGDVPAAVVCEVRYRLHRVRCAGPGCPAGPSTAAAHLMPPHIWVMLPPSFSFQCCYMVLLYTITVHLCTHPTFICNLVYTCRLLTPPGCPAHSLNAAPGAARLATGDCVGVYVGRVVTTDIAEEEVHDSVSGWMQPGGLLGFLCQCCAGMCTGQVVTIDFAEEVHDWVRRFCCRVRSSLVLPA